MAKIVIVDGHTKRRQRMQEALPSQGHTAVIPTGMEASA